MKRLLTYIGSAFLLFTAVFATFGALTSAFGISLPARELLTVWAAVAILLSVIVSEWRGKGLALCLLPILAALYWQRQEIISGAKYVLFYITNQYDMWFGFPVLFRDVKTTASALLTFWRAFGVFLMLPISVAVCMRRSVIMTVTFTLPFVLPSFLMDEFPPSVMFVAALFAVYLTMTFCSALYPDDYRRRALAVFPSLALALALMGAAYIVAPPGNYNRDAVIEDLNEKIRDLTRKPYESSFHGIGWPDLTDDGWSFNTDEVEIADAGTRELSNQEALRVTSTEPGTFYLRGYSMQYFNGHAWSNNSDGMTSDEYAAQLTPAMIARFHSEASSEDSPVLASMTISQSGDRTDVDYTPYYSILNASDGVSFYYTDNILGSAAFLQAAGISYSVTDLSGYNEWARNTYTQLDSGTAEELRRIASRAGIDSGASRAEIADQVAKYISSSARYTLSPYVTPEGADFAIYFLEESRQGYCIHFATAATLMLRALDIPARFTTGFVVTVSDNRTTQDVAVPFGNAHAWVEVYYDDIGWVPLEVTPSSGRNGVPARTEHASASPATPETPEESPDATPGEAPHELPGEENNPDSLPSTSPTPTQSPGTAAGTRGSPAIAVRQSGTLIAALCVIALAALLYLRWLFTGKSRERGLNQEDANAAALYAWQYVHRVSALVSPPKEIEELAMKARYSKHQLSDEERAAVVDYAVTYRAETYEQSGLIRRFWMRFVLGV